MLDDLKDQYFDDIRALLPIHRFFVFALGVLCSLAVQNLTHKSLIETLLNIRLSTLTFDEGGVLESALLGNIAIGILLSTVAWGASSMLTQRFFTLVLQALNANQKIESASKNIRALLAGGRAQNKEELTYFSNKSSDAGKKVRRLASLGEFSLGISICFSVGTIYGNMIDLLVSLIFLIGFFLGSFLAIHAFFSKFIKYDLLCKAITGDRSPIDLPNKDA